MPGEDRGRDHPEDEALFRDLREDEAERESVLGILQAECEVLPGRSEDVVRPHRLETQDTALSRDTAILKRDVEGKIEKPLVKGQGLPITVLTTVSTRNEVSSRLWVLTYTYTLLTTSHPFSPALPESSWSIVTVSSPLPHVTVPSSVPSPETSMVSLPSAA